MPGGATETRIDCVNNAVVSSPLRLLEPAFGYNSSCNAEGCDHDLKVIPQEDSDLVGVMTRLRR